jgi:cyanophycin synthetase
LDGNTTLARSETPCPEQLKPTTPIERAEINLSADIEGCPSRPARVVEKGVYRGPHLYSMVPMVRLQVDLGRLENWPTHKLVGLAGRLVELLPGLHKHGCCYKTPGGFVRRLQDGTWLGHVAEHVAIELQSLAGARVTRGKTRSVAGQPGIYNIMYTYEHEDVALIAGRFALELVNLLLPSALQGIDSLETIADASLGSIAELPDAIVRLRAMQSRRSYGPTTASLVQEARRRDIPITRLDRHSFVQLGYGRNQRRIRGSITGCTSYLGVEAAGDKDLTKALLEAAGVPVPEGVVVTNADDAIQAAQRLGFPVVIKPLDGNHGRGVNMDLNSAHKVRWGFEQAALHSTEVIVERQFEGRDYRILVVAGGVVAVAERLPAHVVGDGRSTVATLIAEANRDPRRGDGHENVMTRIAVDEHLVDMIRRAGLELESTPVAGHRVQLRAAANLSTGGTAIDRTDNIHPDNASFARRAATTLGLDVAGIDFIAVDISRSVQETGGGVVEVNASPGLRMHLHPSHGRARNVARPILNSLFPGNPEGRIPIFAITGTNGKSTTARMLESILRMNGSRVGVTSTTGVYVGGEKVASGDASGPKSAKMILKDPTVDVAVLETARGGILREGLGFDECDIGAVLNVSGDHLGTKGIDTLEQLAAVKSVVVEAVRRGGFSILNADDPLSASMAQHAGGRMVYFSMHGAPGWPLFLREHINDGGRAVTCEPNGHILVHDDGEATLVMRTTDIPATLGGLAEFNAQNALAAIAMAYAHGVSNAVIKQALSTFSSSFEQNPGRLNVIDTPRCRVIMDYAHNAAGLAALGKLLEKVRPDYTRIIGMISMAGDRRDADMRAMGELAAKLFDDLVFWEDEDLRGRERGSVAALLAQGALLAGPGGRIRQILDECEAVEACMKAARRGDLVVVTATDVDKVWSCLGKWTKPSARHSAPATARTLAATQP